MAVNGPLSILLLLYFVVFQTVKCLNKTEFPNGEICDVDQRERLNCSRHVGRLRTDLECFVTCSSDRQCIGASLTALNICFHHHACPAVTGCSVKESSHRFLSRRCFNDCGFDAETGPCIYNGHGTGLLCQSQSQAVTSSAMTSMTTSTTTPDTTTATTIHTPTETAPKKTETTTPTTSPTPNMTSRSPPPPSIRIPPPTVLTCSQLGRTSGEHVVTINLGNGIPLFKVICFYNERIQSVSVYVARNEGTQSFNKSWNEYQNGFFYDSKNHWLGLDNWRHLIRTGYDYLDIELHFTDQYQVEHLYYKKFTLKNSTEKFKIDYNRAYVYRQNNKPSIFDQYHTRMEFGDCLGPVRLSPFSTYDLDSDGDGTQNCASKTSSAWWYPGDCARRVCNFLGWSWKYNQSKPMEQLMHITGMDMTKVGWYLQRVDMYLSIY